MTSIMGKLPSLTLVDFGVGLFAAVAGHNTRTCCYKPEMDLQMIHHRQPPLELQDPASQRAPSPQGCHRAIRSKSSGIICLRCGCQPERLLGNQVGTARFHQHTLHRTGRIRHSCQCDSPGRRRGSTDTESPRGPCETER